jgi:hypothetical protein
MRGNERLPDDQAEIVFSESFLLYLDDLTPDQRESVLAEVVALCDNPLGKPPLSNRSATDRLAGLNTVEVLAKLHRVVFAARAAHGVGLIEVICAGPCTGNAVYDVANALVRSGRLTEAEATQLWDALALLEVVAEGVGIDGWDYRPRPAEAHLVRALVQLGLLPEDLAGVVSRAEAEAAMRDGYDVRLAGRLGLIGWRCVPPSRAHSSDSWSGSGKEPLSQRNCSDLSSICANTSFGRIPCPTPMRISLTFRGTDR